MSNIVFSGRSDIWSRNLGCASVRTPDIRLPPQTISYTEQWSHVDEWMWNFHQLCIFFKSCFACLINFTLKLKCLSRFLFCLEWFYFWIIWISKCLFCHPLSKSLLPVSLCFTFPKTCITSKVSHSLFISLTGTCPSHTHPLTDTYTNMLSLFKILYTRIFMPCSVSLSLSHSLSLSLSLIHTLSRSVSACMSVCLSVCLSLSLSLTLFLSYIHWHLPILVLLWFSQSYVELDVPLFPPAQPPFTHQSDSIISLVTVRLSTIVQNIMMHCHVERQVISTHTLLSHIMHPVVMVVCACCIVSTGVHASCIHANQTSGKHMAVRHLDILQAEKDMLITAGTDILMGLFSREVLNSFSYTELVWFFAKNF